MKRIIDITNTKSITLDNVRVKFKVKLLQFYINELLYKYNNKYAFKEHVERFKDDFTATIKTADLGNDKEATELLNKARELYAKILNYQEDNVDCAEAVDSSLKYILFNYVKNKTTMTLKKEIDMLNELKAIISTVQRLNIPPTDRINNANKLVEQLKTSIINHL